MMICKSDIHCVLCDSSCPYYIEVEPVRHGHWKYLGIAGDRYHYSCSECGYIMYSEKYPYCGNCGAKMDEEVE